MKRLVFPAPLYERLLTSLDLESGVECAAIAFTRPGHYRDGKPRLLVHEVRVAGAEDYLDRKPDLVRMSGTWLVTALVHAQRTGMGVVFIHSHPAQLELSFSATDDDIEQRLSGLFGARATGLHLAMVVSEQGAKCRVLGERESVQIWSSGHRLQRVDLEPSSTEHLWKGGFFDRQILAIGEAGQHQLASMRVAIVGLGGTGSIAAQQLAYLGVKNFLLIDPQTLDRTNLNRVVGAFPADEGQNKVEVAQRMIQSIRPDADVDVVVGDVCDRSTAERLLGVDVILCCTDSHGSRAVVNRIAYQYLIPVIDVGTQIRLRDNSTHLYGRTQLLAPGIPCLHCFDALNSEAIRLDLLTAEARARDPYGLPPGVNQPAVISINGVAVSLAVTMLLQTVTPLAGDARSLRYEGVDGRLRKASVAAQPRCPDCAERFWALGDAVPLLARQEEIA